jgi:hypothetical protein
MRPYGLRIIEHPDVADLQEMGAKTSAGGRNYLRSSAQKRVTRRRWKRLARGQGKAETAEQAEEGTYEAVQEP